METLSKGQKSFLVDATKQYNRSLSGSVAEEHLAHRGLANAAGTYQLGYVADPAPGHEKYQGMLAIPYLRFPQVESVTVVSLRFRCLVPGCAHSGHGKYNTVPEDTGRLYNTKALQGNWDAVGLSEGELDAITATLSGIPTVAVPGATTWKPHWREPFLGFETVYVFKDGDSGGDQFIESVMKKLPNARVITFEPGEDVNSTYTKYGPEALIERMR